MSVMESLVTRRTYRRFAQKPVPQDVVDDIVEAVRLSSCGANRQAVRLVLGQSPEMVANMQPLVHWAAYLPPEQGQPKPDETPVLFVAGCQDESLPGCNDTDTGLALANMTDAAWAHGVGSCIMGAIDRPAIKELLGLGIQPDVLVCRCDAPITEDIRRKIALFCNVQPDCVIQNATAETLYEVPLLMAKEGLDEVVCRKLGLITHQPDLREWSAMVKREKNARKRVSIALVGKYTQLHDAYLSVVESLNHAGTANDAVVDIRWVDSETLTEASAAERLAGCSGILVPGGFGDRGIEGMIAAVRCAREHCIPYFGICLGMPGTKMAECYGETEIWERHRHRYEFNNDFRAEMQVGGMRLAGLSPDGRLVEIIELPDHPWFVGAQFHPEFKRRPDRPHPLFYGFIKASVEKMEADTQ